MQLVLDTKGLTLAKKNGIFHVFNDKSERMISPGKLSSIAITANVRIDASAVILAVKHDIPLLFVNNIGKTEAKTWNPYFSSIAALRRSQIRFSELPDATNWTIDLLELKTIAQVNNLQWIKQHHAYIGRQLSQTIASLKTNSRFDDFRDHLITNCRSNIMGLEGAIAGIYWTALGQNLPNAYKFKTRSRRPAKDIFNAALNYLYGMLYSVVERAVFGVGLDPQLGFLHTDEYTKPTLVFDLIEPFRPWIDQLLIKACFAKQIKPTFFTKNQYGIFLNKTGKAFIIPLFNDFMRTKSTFLGQESSHQNHIHMLCAKLAQRIRTTID